MHVHQQDFYTKQFLLWIKESFYQKPQIKLTTNFKF